MKELKLKKSSTNLPRIFAAAIAAAAMFLCPVLYAATVARVEIEGLEEASESTARDVIGIKEGDEFSRDRAKTAVDDLLKWGVFDTVETETSMSADGVVILFKCVEADTVVSIDVTGNYPYVENKVRKYLTLHPGDAFTPAKLEEQIGRVKAFYEREGFVGTEVYVDQEKLPEWGGTLITFRISRGDAIRIRKIEVSGNKAYPRGRFVSVLSIYRQFSERRLSESLRKLKEFYNEHGYPRARIKVKSKHMDFDAHRVDISLEVFEGPKVVIAFKGARHVSRKLLRRTVTILREGSFDQYEIDASADAIKELLRDRGFPGAKVEAGKEERPDGTFVVTFAIDEGGEERIRRVHFEGARDVSKSDLSAEMRNREMASGRLGTFYPEDESADNEAIVKAMRRRGYLDARVGDWKVAPTPQGFALDLTIPLEQGAQTLTGEISFSGNHAFGVPKLLRELKIEVNDPFDEPGLSADRQRLLTFYSDNGYPYVDVKQRWSTDTESGKAVIHYDIDEGTEVRIGDILIIGDVLTSQNAIKHAMDIREGDPFSYRRIIDSQLNIRRLGPFAAVNIETIGLAEHEKIVHLKVKVEEQRPFQVDLGFGYSTDEQITGSVAFNNINAFGWAKGNTFKLTAGQKFTRAEIGWFDPRFLSSSVEMTGTGWLQYKSRPSYTFVQAGGAIGWFRRFRRFGFYSRYEIDRNYFVTGDSVAANADSLRNNTISRISLSSSYDSRDSFANPTEGFFTLGGVDIFNEIKGNRANFVRFTWQGENEETLLRRITFSTALRFSRIQTIGDNISVPTNELLFLGGDDSIRGYAEDSLGPVDSSGKATGASTRWIVNEELRIRLVSSLNLAFFYDMGSLTNTFTAINGGTIRKGVGAGLRYITPVGPIRADYGFKLGRRPNESVGRFHLTFGYVF
ncbi:MAG: outer membrane protein assembly factor BamA [Pseudomonadota bacterium]